MKNFNKFFREYFMSLVSLALNNNLERISMVSDAEKVELDRQDWFFLYESALGHEVP